MRTFNPPLGRETNIPIASSDSDRFVHLRFTLTFEPAEDTSGTWELWTDIVDVDDNGTVVTAQGEWRSIPFLDPSQLSPHENDISQDLPSESSRIVTLPSSPIVPDVLPAKVEKVAEMVVPARNASYAYTYRRVLTSGETHWLGNGGDNGVVRVIEGEALEQSKPLVEWKGVGIELPSDGSPPVIHDLPNENPTRASILLLRSEPPSVQPVFALSDKPTKGSQTAHSSLVITSNGLKPIPIEARATNPVASGIKYHYDDQRGLGAILKDACNGQSQVQPGSGGLEDQVASLLFCAETTPSTAYLFVYAPQLQQDRTLKPHLPTLASDQAPISLSVVTESEDPKHTFIPAKQISDLVVQLPAGKVATVVQISQFASLAQQGDDVDLWIAGLDSLAHEDSEDVTIPAPKVKAPVPEHIEDIGTESPSTEMTKSISSTTDSPSEASVVESERSVAVKSETSSILHFLRRFFLSLRSWLFGPATSSKAARRSFPTVDDRSVDSSAGVQTPHEGTPLLGTPRISHSPSSTAVSAFGSPQKAGAAMLKTDSGASTGTSASTARDDLNVPPRSALNFTFAKSPFRFLLAPGLSAERFARIEFAYSPKGDHKARKQIVPTRTQAETSDNCDLLVIETEEVEGPWEVQVVVN